METGGLKLQVRWMSFKALRKPEMPIGIGFAPTYLPTYNRLLEEKGRARPRLGLKNRIEVF